MEIFGIEAWLFWFVAAMVLLGAELLVAFTLYFGPIALAALVASVVAALDGSVELQVLAFAVAAVLSLLVVRPIARRHLVIDERVKTGVETLVGKRALVLTEVTIDSGTVKIEGQDWSARIDDEHGSIPAGRRVTVRGFRGAHAVVEPDA
jgi:membrane protein implicated in regulation of membrane protease activity